jgi:hypothetical protein
MSICCLACLLCLVTLVGCGGTSSGSAPLTPVQAIAADKAALAIGYASGDASSSVTKNLTLPTSGAEGSTISWASSNPAVVTTAGVVNQPLTGDASVNLTATITVGATSDTKTFPLTVKAQMTDAEAVAAAKAALAIGYASGDSASSVTQNLVLPATGIDGSTISWASSNSAVVTTAGVVNQPLTGDAGVTLTANITVGAASDTKTFPLTVKGQLTDAEAVAAAKAALAIGYASGDAATSVTQNLILATTGLDGCTVSWSSSDSAISADGTVSRPVTGDLPVTLTATLTHDAATDTKNFIVIVKAQMTDTQAVAAAKEALLIGYAESDSAASVTQNLSLPLTGSSGCTVSWASSDPTLVSSDGTVTRPLYGDAQVTFIATITSHEASDTADFTVTLKGQMSDADAVATAKAALNVIYASGDSAASVTQNVTLPASGVDGCSISWASDTPATVATNGAVTQPLGDDVIVKLTATIRSHAVTDTKEFSLTVKAVMNDASAVAADKTALLIVYGPGDSASSVRHNIVLPTSGTNGSNITWNSSNPAVITSSGGVTVPTDEDALVTMTATISKGSASDTATFDLTVKALLLSSWVNVAAISPGNGAIEVDPGIVIRIPFQRALDESTVNTTTFQLLKTSNSQNVDISVGYDSDSQTVSLTPLSPLEQGTQYTTVVAGTLKDWDATPLPSPMGFNFTILSYDDILSQWKFNGDGSDSSGHANVFTPFNEFGDSVDDMYVNDVVHEGSGSLYLNGFWQYGMSDINLGSQLTVAVWVNVDNPIQPDINTILSNTGTGEESNGFKLGINCWDSSDRSVMIEVGDGATGGKWTTAPGLIQPGNWYHLAFVIDQPNHLIKIFYNGAQAPLSFKSDQHYTLDEFNYSFNTAGPFTIGAFPGGMDFNYKGHLDDMRVYNRVLSDEEIAKIAQEK